MILSQVLNSEASLNAFFEISQITYVPGENMVIVVRLIDRERGIRYVADNPAAIVTLSFEINSTPAVPLDVVAVEVAPLDRSIWRVSLSVAQVMDLAGSNIQVTLDKLGDGTEICRTVLRNILRRTTLSGDC